MEYLRLMRPKHYIKNLLIFLPLFFSGDIFNLLFLFRSILGFICFCFIASSVYIINDIKDVNLDMKHEIKKNRPIASGKVSIRNAKILLIFLIITVIAINLFLIKNYLSFVFLIIYLLINIAYSFGLKEKPIIDIFILSTGFLIRVIYGGTLLGIHVSNWLFLTVLCGSLYMSMGKRRNELKKGSSNTRSVLKYYNMDFFDKNMYMFLSMSLIFFSLWATELENRFLLFSIIIVFILCLRYSYDIENDESFGDPVDVIVNDKAIIILTFLLVISFVLSLYIIPMLEIKYEWL